MFWKTLAVSVGVLGTSFCLAQEAVTPPKPQVKVHMLNVCAPSPEEQQEIAFALSRVPLRPTFAPDFEVDRGRSVLADSTNLLGMGANSVTAPAETASADFVRIRRDFAGPAGIYLNVQYSFSRDKEQMVETLVFRVREAKDLLQLSIEDSAAVVTTASAMLSAATPAARIKLERFGKSSVVLARCTGDGGRLPDQSALQPLFSSASAVLSGYRGLLNARSLVPEELTRIGSTGTSATRRKSSTTPPHK